MALEVMDTTFYTLCDQLGLLVWQDMPSGDMRAMPLWSDSRAMAEDLRLRPHVHLREAFATSYIR